MTGVLAPVFDNVCYIADHEPPSQEDSEWLASTCSAALSQLVNLFSHFFSKINFLLPEYLVLLTRCILQDNKVGQVILFCLTS
jgi:Sec7-like guanine-nucleotide exchange factor